MRLLRQKGKAHDILGRSILRGFFVYDRAVFTALFLFFEDTDCHGLRPRNERVEKLHGESARGEGMTLSPKLSEADSCAEGAGKKAKPFCMGMRIATLWLRLRSQ